MSEKKVKWQETESRISSSIIAFAGLNADAEEWAYRRSYPLLLFPRSEEIV